MHTGVEVLVILIPTPLHKRLDYPVVPLLIDECEHCPYRIIFADQRVSPAKKVHFHPAFPIAIETVPKLTELKLGRQLLSILLELADSPLVKEILFADASLVKLWDCSIDSD